jgi:hypothetical protein
MDVIGVSFSELFGVTVSETVLLMFGGHCWSRSSIRSHSTGLACERRAQVRDSTVIQAAYMTPAASGLRQISLKDLRHLAIEATVQGVNRRVCESL